MPTVTREEDGRILHHWTQEEAEAAEEARRIEQQRQCVSIDVGARLIAPSRWFRRVIGGVL